MNFKFGDYVWFKKEGWIFIGMDEEGSYNLCRPAYEHVFGIMEFEQVCVEDFDDFFKENGEPFNKRMKRKGIKHGD